MTDEFVRNAFESAEKAALDAEFNAYKETILDRREVVNMAVSLKVGIEKMNILLETVMDGKCEDILVEYLGYFVIEAFHLGWTSAKEDK